MIDSVNEKVGTINYSAKFTLVSRLFGAWPILEYSIRNIYNPLTNETLRQSLL